MKKKLKMKEETKIKAVNPPLQQAIVVGCALIDVEFTGLDNSVVSDNEIIQVKILNVHNKKSVIKNFNSKKTLSAHALINTCCKLYADLFSTKL